MNLKLTILCENSVERVHPAGLIGEHGFACHLQTDQGNYLFDTGSGLGLFHNSERMGIDLSDLEGIILSHGHCDHTGGLQQLLEITGPLPIYGHPDIFTRHHSNNGGQLRDIGIPYDKDQLEQLGGIFHLSAEPQTINPRLTTSGEIPQIHPTSGDANLLVVTEDGQRQPDPLADDLSLFITTDKGLIILLGCAHAGLFNIIDQALKITGQNKIHLLLGGTHLKFTANQQLEEALTRLAEYQIDKIGVSHCTGLRPAQKLAEQFGERFFSATVGTEIEI